MSSRALPARANLDHLRNEAKALHKAARDADPEAIRRIQSALGHPPPFKLTDAQRALAREYGFATWARLRAHVEGTRGWNDAVAAFLAAVEEQDGARAEAVVHAHPRIANESLHVAAVLGRAADAAKLIAADPTTVAARAGGSPAEPLLWLCYSPFHGESPERDAGLLATARLLLAAGADPNTTDSRHGVPALFAVTGMRSVLPIARLLLDAGANPTDGESVFHAAERFHEDALELLLAAGADLNRVGDWGNTPLYFLLRWYDVERQATVRRGFVWLLEHGADPNVRCGTEQENSLHSAARRGQDPAIVRLLLEFGADVHALSGDGATAWRIAARGGFEGITAVLEQAGAEPEPLSALDRLLAACGRGDVDAAGRLATPELRAQLNPADQVLLPQAASVERDATVLACLAAGFPVNTTDPTGATALHYAVIHGRAAVARALLAAGSDTSIRDRQHSSTPMGWACFGADFVADENGDYEGCVRALLDAGARPRPDEHQPAHAGVRQVIAQRG